MSELDINCANLTDLVTLHLEAALEPEDQLRFETHLVYCDECRAFLGQIRFTVDRLRRLPPLPPPDPAGRDALLAAFRSRP